MEGENVQLAEGWVRFLGEGLVKGTGHSWIQKAHKYTRPRDLFRWEESAILYKVTPSKLE